MPNLSGHFENGVLATNATDTSDWSETDKFALINVSTVLGASWLCSLCYGLNVRGELTHYPVSKTHYQTNHLIVSYSLDCILYRSLHWITSSQPILYHK